MFTLLRDAPDKGSTGSSAVVVAPDFGLDVHTRNSASSAIQTYNFDGVFGPQTTQEQIYEKIASPILEEVMQGYSCTIFAYGQTGTGKTYTMQGDLESASSETGNGGVVKGDPLASLQVSTNAGLIPRTLHNLFYILDKQSADYKVHVSYVELYNEELVDLLSSGNSGKGAGIKLLDSGQDKGMFIQHLTEIRVRKAKGAMDLLEAGTNRRKVAATRCNKESSRSHAIFTITVKITERDETGDGQVIEKLGKLNLVDLAGSENVGRSGADARETSSINKSLLALGQVIAAVAKRSPHVPYRDSKLTQMLRDSLGGHTRACMIATINTSQQSFPETVKTLKYASQAKDVRNKPIANKCVVRADIVDNLQKEIDKLRFDLKAARDGEGFYLTSDTYKALTEGAAQAHTQAEEWKLRVDLLETEIVKSRADAELQTTRIDQLERSNAASAEALQESLAQQERLVEQLKAESLLTRAHAYHEQELGIAARQLRTDLAQSRSEGEQLHAKTMRLVDREQRNVEAATRVSRQAQADAEQVLALADSLGARAAGHVGALLAALQSRIGTDFDRLLAAHVDTHASKLRTELERVAETFQGESESKAGLIEVALDAADALSAGLRNAVEIAATEIDSACVALATDAQAYQLQLSEQLRSSAAAVRQILDAAQADSDAMLREAQAQSELLIKQIRAESLELQQRSADNIAALQRQMEELQAEELKADESDMLAIAQMLAQRRKRSAAMSSVILERATANADARNTLAQAQVDRSNDATQAQVLAARTWHAGTCAAHTAAAQRMEADASTTVVSVSTLVRGVTDHRSLVQARLSAVSLAVAAANSETTVKLASVRQEVEAVNKVGATAVQLASSAATYSADGFTELLSEAVGTCSTARDEVAKMAQTQAVDFGSSITAMSADIAGIATTVQRGLVEGVQILEPTDQTPSRPATQRSPTAWNVTRPHAAILALYPANEHSDQLDWTGEPACLDGEPTTGVEPMDVASPTTPRKRPSETDISPCIDVSTQRPVRRPRTRMTLNHCDSASVDENDPPIATLTPPSEPDLKQVSGIPMPRRTRRVRN
ncbi:Kinesin- motor protein [Coemansia aciculifera]|nr:Kinesin- motor protein [Coemansia aciculifera]